MPVGALPFGPDMVFGASRSMQAPASYSGASAAAAEANARLSAQINSMLCAARFAHLLKVMGRDMVGSFRTADEIERQLNRWLQDYVNTNINSTSEFAGAFPAGRGQCAGARAAGKAGRVRLHHSPAAALSARRRRGRLPRRDRTRGARRRYRGGSMSPSSPSPRRRRPSVPRRQPGRRADGGQCRGSQDADRHRRAGFCLPSCWFSPATSTAPTSFSMPAPTSTRRLPWWWRSSASCCAARRQGGNCSARGGCRNSSASRPPPSACRWPPSWRCATAIRHEAGKLAAEAEEARVHPPWHRRRRGIRRYARRRRPAGVVLRGHHHDGQVFLDPAAAGDAD